VRDDPIPAAIPLQAGPYEFKKILFRSDWPLVGPTVGLKPDTRNLLFLTPETCHLKPVT
jgi:hypothetical protein